LVVVVVVVVVVVDRSIVDRSTTYDVLTKGAFEAAAKGPAEATTGRRSGCGRPEPTEHGTCAWRRGKEKRVTTIV
jgi:hypothetical protein